VSRRRRLPGPNTGCFIGGESFRTPDIPASPRGSIPHGCRGGRFSVIFELHPTKELSVPLQSCNAEEHQTSTANLRNTEFHFILHIRSFRTVAMAPMKSWLSIPIDSHFSLANIPFGIITSKHSQVEKRPAVAIGDHVLDLKAFASENGFSGLPSLKDSLEVFSKPSLNAFAALGQPVHREIRKYFQDIFSESTSHPQILKDNAALQKAALLPKHETKTHLPMQIGDYTDFFAGKNHAFNLGTMFRVLDPPFRRWS